MRAQKVFQAVHTVLQVQMPWVSPGTQHLGKKSLPVVRGNVWWLGSSGPLQWMISIP